MSEPDEQADVLRAWNREVFALQRSIRYHARRQAFFDFWNALTNATSIILGVGTVAAMLDKVPQAEALRILFPVAIAIVSTLNLVWATSRRARLHNDLYRRFVELERKTIAPAVGEQAWRALRMERLAIEADEPPAMYVLEALCHNEVVRANGGGEYYEVPLWQRWLAHFWAFPNARFATASSSFTRKQAV